MLTTAGDQYSILDSTPESALDSESSAESRHNSVHHIFDPLRLDGAPSLVVSSHLCSLEPLPMQIISQRPTDLPQIIGP